MAAAIDTATEMLLTARDAPEDRELAILLLSDDFPTVPPPAEFAARKAIQSARNASQKRIRIYSFALGVEPGTENLDSLALREIARVTHGAYTAPRGAGGDHRRAAADRPDRARRHPDPQPHHRRRCQRHLVRPDGTFDGFVALRKGRNVLRVTATGPNGGVAVQDRIVFYRPRRRANEEDLRELQELKDRIREIQVEQELLREMDARRKAPRNRELDVEVE